MNVDTLSIARDLKATELPAAQAEAIAAAIGRAVTDGVATKSDIQLMEERLSARLGSAKTQLLTWLMGRYRRHGWHSDRGVEAVIDPFRARGNWAIAQFVAAMYIIACITGIALRTLR
ncbi:hypothetical protein MC45_10250 [Sphingomonas taxi]|uniref:DUF1640 domain-containing protein n=1 Tax=Sphingomonas taxi TaxID=1549858 RepID=A0A097EGK6_9SPHN|nr:hypothetical protein [Sphingomonas taxi]AIT06691.1 hypothetical protein MC45_10250 [Sphingomonas taxi]